MRNIAGYMFGVCVCECVCIYSLCQRINAYVWMCVCVCVCNKSKQTTNIREEYGRCECQHNFLHGIRYLSEVLLLHKMCMYVCTYVDEHERVVICHWFMEMHWKLCVLNVLTNSLLWCLSGGICVWRKRYQKILFSQYKGFKFVFLSWEIVKMRMCLCTEVYEKFNYLMVFMRAKEIILIYNYFISDLSFLAFMWLIYSSLVLEKYIYNYIWGKPLHQLTIPFSHKGWKCQEMNARISGSKLYSWCTLINSSKSLRCSTTHIFFNSLFVTNLNF